jgi:hypothetical protein
MGMKAQRLGRATLVAVQINACLMHVNYAL